MTNTSPVWLEIGFGGGEHLAAQARANPDVEFIGCEPFRDGVLKLIRELEIGRRANTSRHPSPPPQAGEGTPNVRIWPDDARLLLEKLPDASISRVFILFPDPWPKKRHHKRRLIQPGTLDTLARVMRPGAELRLATDHAEYGAWMLEHLLADERFEWKARTPDDFRLPPPDWVITRYQKKAEKEGRAPLFLNWVRK